LIKRFTNLSAKYLMPGLIKERRCVGLKMDFGL